MSDVDAVADDRAKADRTGRADPGERALRARRIDWRLVLPDASPGRVRWLGEADDAALAALLEAGWTRVPAAAVAAPTPGATSDAADLVVVGAATSEQLTTAVRSVAPGGSIYVAIAAPWRRLGRRPRPLSAARVRRRLASAGLTGIRLQAHLPGAERRSAIVPLDEPAALHLLLAHRGGLPASRPARAAAEAARRRGWLGRFLPSVSVVARRPLPMPDGSGSAPGADRDAVSSWLAAVLPADAAGRPAPLLLTPSFRASRHVVALVPDMDGRRVATVAKIARIADSGTVTDREAAVLQALRHLAPAVRDAAPEALATGRPWRLPALVESGVDGTPLDPATVRRDPDAALGLVLPWLAALVTDSDPVAPAAARVARLVEGPLDGFAAAFAATDAERHRIERTRRIAAGLGEERLPVAVEHGDVSHPNLLVGRAGQLAAVDWELGEPAGLPAHDLACFLGYLAIARARAERPAEQRAALRAMLLGESGWADTAATRYATAIGLDPGLLPALAVVAWARRVISLVERLYDGPATSLDDETLGWIRDHRWTTAWEAALERHDRADR